MVRSRQCTAAMVSAGQCIAIHRLRYKLRIQVLAGQYEAGSFCCLQQH